MADTFNEQKGGCYYSLYNAEVPNHYRLLRFNEQYKNCNPEFCYAHYIGPHGFIGNPPLEKNNRIRILAFGDSFMEGVGALSPDSSVPVLLQQHLNRDSACFEVFNFGNGGSDVVFEMKYILDSVARFQPDMVMMMYNNSDIGDIIQWGGEERFRADGNSKAKSGPWFAWLYGHLRLVRLVVANGLRYDRELLLSASAYEQEKEKAIETVIIAGVKSAEYCLKHNADFVMVLMPFGPDIALQKETSAVFFAQLDERLRKAGVKTINLFEPMASEMNNSNSQIFWWQQDGHYCNRGYELIARIIADSLSGKMQHNLCTHKVLTL